jgi:glycosyltransferase involved in cell wall biosynthesis
MKILLAQLISRGGIQLYISQLANALSKTDNEVIVLLGEYLFDECYYTDHRIKIICVDTLPSYSRMTLKMLNPLTYFYIFKIINKEKPDVIHIVFEDILLGITSHFLKKKYPVVVTEHDPSFHKGEKIYRKLHHGFSKLITRRADAIIVHGKTMKKILVNKNVSEDKIYSIPHGDYSIYAKWKKEEIKEEKAVLFFGSIKKYKGIEYLIKAEPLITSFIPNAKIIIAGSGDFKKYEVLIKNKNSFEIHNRFIPDEEVAEFFQRSSVVVLPYIDGSQTGIIPIAYSFKKPVVVTDVGSIPEVVDDEKTGYVVPPRNSEALAEAIIKLLKDDELRKKLGENAYKKMREDLSWDKIAEKTIGVYKAVIMRKQ